jgi:hypothetical protein
MRKKPSTNLELFDGRLDFQLWCENLQDQEEGLVIPSIIETEILKDSLEAFEVYPKSVKVVRPAVGYYAAPVLHDRTGQELQGFSMKSKARLRFVAVNSGDKVRSQFCLTYGDYWPVNGKEAKRQLHAFLVMVEKHLGKTSYIWVGEFQTRGAPHFHLFSSLEVTEENHKFMAETWHRIAGINCPKHLAVHLHQRNFIEWNMGNGGYLCKYLDKQHQKCIPPGFGSFGRWWGNSRDMKPQAEVLDRQGLDAMLSGSIDHTTGEMLIDDAGQYLLRTLRKYKKSLGGKRFKVRRLQSQTFLTGAAVFIQTENYLQKMKNNCCNKISNYSIKRPSLIGTTNHLTKE